ncbi:hypothetical protein JFU18_20625 [Bacillus sp. TH22]|uniref:hypothetical protein n=1 Tax=unclassified Bacillus (in: firmicutes) TaxID=185979 RepID=UPI0019115E3F|nr:MULTISPECIES: hypothetical protein [unclassified Bacillus (in: firmicutes)]MBK5450902.1 hypothetical protein [Bacillus sp. TH22]MBK5455356.1 hypothetical protein [Bacillus sp. TH23]
MESRLTIRRYANKDEDINETLNRIAILAKEEVEDYYTGICDNKYVEKIEAHYIPLIERLAKDNWYKINNEVHFIDDCFRRIEYTIRTFDINRGDFDKRIKCFIYQALRKYCGERGRGQRRKVLTLIGDIKVLETLEDCTDTTEEKAICNVMTNRDTYAKLYENICKKKIDFIVLDTMIHTVENNEKVTEVAISRALSKKTGRSFDSARSTVRGFKQRIRKRNIRKGDKA